MTDQTISALYVDSSPEAKELVSLHKKLLSFERVVGPIDGRVKKLGTEDDGPAVRRHLVKIITDGQAQMKEIMEDINRINGMDMSDPSKKKYADVRKRFVDDFSHKVKNFKRAASKAEESLKDDIPEAARTRTWGRLDTSGLSHAAAELRGEAAAADGGGDAKSSHKPHETGRSKSEIPADAFHRKKSFLDMFQSPKKDAADEPPERIPDELWIAASEGNLDVVKQQISSLKDVNCHNEEAHHSTLLHCAAAGGFCDIVKFLKEKGADVNSRDDEGQTPLMRAAKKGHVEVIKYLMDHRADLDAEDKEGRNALNFAAKSNSLESVQLLLSSRPSKQVKHKDQKGKTPVHEAVKSHNVEIVKFLLEKYPSGAKAKDSKNETPLHAAATEGVLEIVKMLVEAYPGVVKEKDKKDITPLHNAAHEGHLEVVKYLVEQKADIDSKDDENRTPLHHAADKKRFEVVKYLVEQHANVDCKDKKGRTPLHLAADEGMLEIVKFLVEQHATVDSKDQKNKTPLHYAVDEGYLDIVKYLIEQHANVNCEDKSGETAFFKAVDHKQTSILEWWIEEAAKEDQPGVLSPSFHKVLFEAVKEGNLKVVRLLVKNGASVDAMDENGLLLTSIAMMNNQEDVLEFLLENDADVDVNSSVGEDILHIAQLDPKSVLVQKAFLRAAREDNMDLLKLLLERGVKPSAVLKGGLIPINIVVGYGRYAMAQFLIEKGADLNPGVADPPLYFAVLSRNCELVRLLLDKGANVNVELKYKWTPLHFAASDGNLDIIRCLVEHGADIKAKGASKETPINVSKAENVAIFFQSLSK